MNQPPAFPSYREAQVEWLAFTWIIISFIALQFLKVNMVLWIGVSLGIGIITFILQGL